MKLCKYGRIHTFVVIYFIEYTKLTYPYTYVAVLHSTLTQTYMSALGSRIETKKAPYFSNT